MTNQPREFCIRQETFYWENSDKKEFNCAHNKKLNNKEASHVIEEGPVLEKIKRLEAALQKCKEQRGICTEIHANGLCRYQIMEKEIESILEGK